MNFVLLGAADRGRLEDDLFRLELRGGGGHYFSPAFERDGALLLRRESP